MIQAEALTKDYGSRRVLDRISFEVPQGAVLGFLGPNGAGKTTTMRILTGLARATSGRVRIGGFDVVRQQRDVARILGYLPEDAPLYPEMRVESYLATMAALKEIPARKVKSEVDRVLSETDLQKWRKRLISNISKGTRQRVGIAQALLGDPKVLVLDEPTVGLDPGQISDIRSLIARMRGSKTVIFSTHLMDNAERLCDSVCIIARGEKVLDGTVSGVKAAQGDRAVALRLSGEMTAEVTHVLSDRSLVARADHHNRFVEVELAAHADPQTLLQRLVAAGAPIERFERVHPSLHQIFLEKVGATGIEDGMTGNG